MIPKHSKWRTCIAVMLSALLLFTPAMTGFSVAKVLEPANSLSYHELYGAELDTLAQKAISDSGVQQLVEHLAGKDAYLTGKRAATFQFDGRMGNVVLLNYKGRKDIQIVFSESEGNVKVGAGVFKITDKKTQIEVYDLVDGKIYHSSTITVLKDANGRPGKPSVEWHSSPLTPKKAVDLPSVSILATSNCNTCLQVCSYIYAAGCGFSGYFVCLAACAPIGTLACPIICGVVWAIICQYGSSTNCPLLCQMAGYCP